MKIGRAITRERIGSIRPKACRYGIDSQSATSRHGCVNWSNWFRPNEIYSINFANDALYDGRRLHVRVVVDNYGLAIEVGQSVKGEDVARALNCLNKNVICRR